jgi:hypothetical protein
MMSYLLGSVKWQTIIKTLAGTSAESPSDLLMDVSTGIAAL